VDLLLPTMTLHVQHMAKKTSVSDFNEPALNQEGPYSIRSSSAGNQYVVLFFILAI
jgi:hypothetical protein